MPFETEVVVIGAGVVGLACAATLARGGHELVLLERHEGPARETSGRNSGVVHAGLYYEPGSLKAASCVEGRALLYARCGRDGVAHRKTGKIVVACTEEEIPLLESLHARGRENGAGALALLGRSAIERLEPRVRAIAGLFSPESGIVDVHALVGSYVAEARSHGASIAFRTSVEALEPHAEGWTVSARDADGERVAITARWVINAAGLGADRIATMAGLDVDALGWRLRYCKGDYFAFAPRLRALTQHLVYPVPVHAGLGVHVTMDLGGAYRAGPDTEYVDAPCFDVSAEKAGAFAAAVRRYIPSVEDDDLTPDYAGVRPKLQGPGEPPRDFVLEEQPRGLVHLVGIESPGLTASEALARRVAILVGRCRSRAGRA